MIQLNKKARLIKHNNLDWNKNLPGHVKCYSRTLVGPENVGSELFDFHISKCLPGGVVKEHSHQKVEHVYWGHEGSGIVTAENKDYKLEPEVAIYIPAGCKHKIVNNTSKDLYYLVVNVPANDM